LSERIRATTMAANPTSDIQTTPKATRVLMWNVSSPTADALFTFSNVLLICGALAIFIGTIGAFSMSAAKEFFANARIAANEADTARAKESAAQAGERAAQADSRAAEANLKAETERVERLKLEAKYAPRILSDEQATSLQNALASLKGNDVDIVSYEGLGTDVAMLSQQIAAVMGIAGINAKVFTPMGGSGLVRGIAVRTEVGSMTQIEATVDKIVKALSDAGLAATKADPYPVGEVIAGGFMGPTGVAPTAKVRVLVGAKP
jgi:hypothetical protein